MMLLIYFSIEYQHFNSPNKFQIFYQETMENIN